MTLFFKVSMDIMREFAIPVPRGFMATNASEVVALHAEKINGKLPVVLKAMVLAG